MGVALSVVCGMSTPKQRFLESSVWAAALFLLSGLQPAPGVVGFGINLMKVPAENKGLEACILALLRKYFESGDGLSGSVLCFNRNYQLPYLQDQILRGMNSYEGYPWSLLITNFRESFSSSELQMQEKPQCYFLIVESLEDEDLDEVYEHWKNMVNWNPLAQFVVFLATTEETDEEMTDVMVEVLLTFMNKKIFNVNIIGQSEENEFFYGKSVFPYHPDNNCGNRVISVELLDACDYVGDENEEKEEDEDDGDGEQEEDGSDGEQQEDGSQENIDKNASEDTENDQPDIPQNGNESGEKDYDESEVGEAIASEESQDINNETEVTTEENLKSTSQESIPDYKQDQKTNDYESIKPNEKGEENAQDEAEDEESSRENISNEQDFYADNYQNSEINVVPRNHESMLVNKVFARYSGTFDSYEDISVAQNSAQNESSTLDKAFNKTEISSEDLENQSEEKRDNSNVTEPEVIIEEFYRAKFEDKFPRDLSGCPLTAAFRPWEPYIFRTEVDETTDDYYYDVGTGEDYNETSSYGDSDDETYVDPEADYDNPAEDTETESTPKVKLNGIEYEMVQTIAERLHVNIEMQKENTNLYHLFQRLIDGEIEMIVGGIDEDPSISQFVSSSVSYHQDDLTWCVAKAKRRYGFFNFVETFNADAGFLMGLFVVVCSIVVLLAQRVSRFRLRNLNGYFSICLRITGILLNQAIPMQDFPLTLRQLFAISFLMGFFFSNTYQSFLISSLTNPRSSYQIHTLDEIHSHGMVIMGTSENVRHFNKEGEVFKYIREKFQMCYNIVDCLNDAAHNDHIAVAVSRQHSFYNPRIQRDRLYCFDRRESLYVYQVTMLLPRKYHLLHQINPVIQHIIESGHMQKWARDLDMRRKIHEEITRVREDPFKALTFDQFRGAFAFSFGLLLMASCVFFMECLYVKCFNRAKKRKLLKKLTSKTKTRI